MDLLINALERLPESRKIEITLFLLKSLGIREIGHRYTGSGLRSILFYQRDNGPGHKELFELVTMDKHKKHEQKEKEI